MVISIIGGYVLHTLYMFADELRRKEGIARRNVLFLQRWLMKANANPGFLTKELVKRGYRKVYIYGAGIFGNQLYDSLDKTQIEVVGFIDRSANEIGVGVPIYRLEDVDNANADAVVVTVIKNMESVVGTIRKKLDLDVVLLDDLI
jgi:FlaA1/EpsC-like NDP-sugar epimerase